MKIVALIFGFILGIWTVTVILLPLFYGIPKSSKLFQKNSITRKVFRLQFYSPILWIFIYLLIFIGSYHFLPSFSAVLFLNRFFFAGLFIGLLISLFRAHSKEGKKDIKHDFESLVTEDIEEQKNKAIDWFLTKDEKILEFRELFPDKIDETKEKIIGILENNSEKQSLIKEFLRIDQTYKNEIFPKYRHLDISFKGNIPKTEENLKIIFRESQTSVIRRILGFFLIQKYNINPLDIIKESNR